MIHGNQIANWIYWEFHNPSNPFVESDSCAEECQECTNDNCVNEEMEGKFIYDGKGEIII